MARFSIYGSYLYVVDNGQLGVFHLNENGAVRTNTVWISTAVETLFAYNDNLFMGMSNGMAIYSLEILSAPKHVSTIWHAWGCDPVVVSGNYAYLTLRSGNLCGQASSVLDVIDISNIAQPRTVASYSMVAPYGLGICGNTLFVCDDGLKVFDATNPIQVGRNQILHIANIKGYDLIPYNNVLILIGDDGLYQYCYADINNITQLSHIAVRK
jgi:hypothetical protein